MPISTRVKNVIRRLWRNSNNYILLLQQIANNPRRHGRPIFLVGCGRSGTTMIATQVSKSWQIKLYNEEDHSAAFKEWRLRELSVIDKIIAEGFTPLKMFKPILETPRSQELLTHYPVAQLIFVFRHYNDVVNSALKKEHWNWPGRLRSWVENDFSEFSDTPPPLITQGRIRSLWTPSITTENSLGLYWLFYNSLYFDLELSKHSRVYLIEYERLVKNPEQEIRSYCQFIGVKFHQSMTKGIYTSSIVKETPPKIEGSVLKSCEVLWSQLSESQKFSKFSET